MHIVGGIECGPDDTDQGDAAGGRMWRPHGWCALRWRCSPRDTSLDIAVRDLEGGVRPGQADGDPREQRRGAGKRSTRAATGSSLSEVELTLPSVIIRSRHRRSR